VPYTPLILVLLLILFSSVTYLNYHFAGIPYSYAYDSEVRDDMKHLFMIVRLLVQDDFQSWG